MRDALIPISAAIVATFIGTAANAATITSVSLNLRTGPTTAYPAIVVVPARQAVVVYGCTAGPGWCDVGWGGYRGWIAAAYVGGPISAYPVLVYDPVVYHNTYYVGRPYYGIGPGLPPRVEARRDARIGYRVDRRMDRRWDRWGHD